MKISQYCSVCKAEYDMDVVPTDDDDGVLWLQCPLCKGYLPKVKSSLQVVDAQREEDARIHEGESGTDADDKSATLVPGPADLDLDAAAAVLPDSDDDADLVADHEAAGVAGTGDDLQEGLELLEAMDVSEAVPYRPWRIYAKGDILHHLAWDDHGVVLDKEMLPGNRCVLKVRFAEAGLVRLIEDDGSRPA